MLEFWRANKVRLSNVNKSSVDSRQFHMINIAKHNKSKLIFGMHVCLCVLFYCHIYFRRNFRIYFRIGPHLSIQYPSKSHYLNILYNLDFVNKHIRYLVYSQFMYESICLHIWLVYCVLCFIWSFIYRNLAV